MTHLQRAMAWCVAAWLVLVGAWLTWAPFDFGGRGLVMLVPQFDPVDLPANLILLAPFALVLMAIVPALRLSSAFAVFACISLAFEAGQYFLEARVVAPSDIVLNVAGALIIAMWMRRRAENLLPSVRIRVVIATACMVFTAISLFTLYTHQRLRSGMRLTN